MAGKQFLVFLFRLPRIQGSRLFDRDRGRPDIPLLPLKGKWFIGGVLGCVLFENEDFLVVNKPPGLELYATRRFGQTGFCDWLRKQKRDWSEAAPINNLDREMSGTLVMVKSGQTGPELGEAGERQKWTGRFLFRTSQPWPAAAKEIAKPTGIAGESTTVVRFRHLENSDSSSLVEAEASLETTSTIRSLAARVGMPILGDTANGGRPWPRLCLHLSEVTCRGINKSMRFHAPVDFSDDPTLVLRTAIVDPEQTDAFRLIHAQSDGWPGWYVDKLGSFLLSQAETALDEPQRRLLERLQKKCSADGVYHKVLTRHVRKTSAEQASPRWLAGETAPAEFSIKENGARFLMSFDEGYSTGIFLDQRENRRRLLQRWVGGGFRLFDAATGTPEVLNTFAYTCAFSVCAARSGARVTSLDLSKKYLDWGRRNFAANGIEPASHDFIYGDTFDWLKRMAKKQRQFDLVILDPPTFSQSKQHGVFRAEKDYGELMAAALPVLKTGGVMLASTNAAKLDPENFLQMVRDSVRRFGRRIGNECFETQPLDFPVSAEEPAYLKTVWMRID